MAVFEAAGRAIDRARQGDGPTLIECKTYRNYGHFEGDQQTYKYDSPEEEAFAKRDDIQEFRAYAVSEGLFTAAEADQIEQQSTDDIEAAVKFAEDSPLPDPESLYEDVFAD
ncbi:acetoin dehydrogenase E1 component alpha-subunit [Agrilactobacillus composti DSM 18527 = JCM 14202]|nr:acetoin dehydrogenase E1 component alpha-subunit [Agrilactobacillus composti DSM 18527 = JCM 14202]